MNRQAAAAYLSRVLGDHTGHVALAAKATEDTNLPYRKRLSWPDQKDAALDWAEAESAKGHNVFVIPALRDNPDEPKAGDAVHLAWLWADIDWQIVPEDKRERTAAFLKAHATFQVLSGSEHDGRKNTHAYFKLNHEVSADEHYSLNTGLKGHLYADTKQSDTAYLRLPGTSNHKGSQPVPVVMVPGTDRAVSSDVLRGLRTNAVRRNRSPVEWERVPVPTTGRAARIARSRPGECKYAPTEASDRSAAVWAIIGDLIKAGLAKDQVHTLMDDAPMVESIQADRPYDVHKDIEKRWAQDGDDDVFEAAEDEVSDLFQDIDWDQAFSDTPEQVEWLVEPLIERGALVALFSPPKEGKSLLTLEIAACLAVGRPILGEAGGSPRHVMYVDFENSPKDFVGRLKAMGFTASDLKGWLHYKSFPAMETLDTEAGGQQLYANAKDCGAELVVIDTVSRIIDGGENDADTFKDMYRHSLVRLKRDDIACIRLDHSGKDAEKGQRGSSAKNADVDVVWRLARSSKTRYRLSRDFSRQPSYPEAIDLTRVTEPLLRHEMDGVLELEEGEVVIDIPDPPANVLKLVQRLDDACVPLDYGRMKIKNEFGISGRGQSLLEAISWRRARGLTSGSR